MSNSNDTTQGKSYVYIIQYPLSTDHWVAQPDPAKHPDYTDYKMDASGHGSSWANIDRATGELIVRLEWLEDIQPALFKFARVDSISTQPKYGPGNMIAVEAFQHEQQIYQARYLFSDDNHATSAHFQGDAMGLLRAYHQATYTSIPLRGIVEGNLRTIWEENWD